MSAANVKRGIRMKRISKANALWFLGALVLPYLSLYVAHFLLSLIWESTKDMPRIFLLPVDMVPYFLLIGVLLYCFSEIHFSTWWSKVLVISSLLINLCTIGPVILLIVVCDVWNDCF